MCIAALAPASPSSAAVGVGEIWYQQILPLMGCRAGILTSTVQLNRGLLGLGFCCWRICIIAPLVTCKPSLFSKP